MQIGRLFEMVYLLLERGGMTAQELAERFEVSTRTIYRDLDVLSGAGIPVYAAKGRGGGIRLLPDFVLDKSLLSPQEQDQILFALQSLGAAGPPEDNRVLERLSTLFRRERTDWIDVDFSAWGSGPAGREDFERIRTGILQRRLLEFSYCGSNGSRSLRRVEPVKLCFKERGWYLQAYCRMREDFRVFKVVRMEGARLLEESFAPRPLPPPELEVDAPEWEVQLELWFSPKAAYRMYDEFPREWVRPQEDGSYRVSAHYPNNGWVCGWLLSFGEEVRVLEPQWMAEAVQEQAGKILRLYDHFEK